MLEITVSADAQTRDEVERILTSYPYMCDLTHLRDSQVMPEGDLFMCNVPRECATELVEQLRATNVEKQGSIRINDVTTLISDRARKAEDDAPGMGADAIVWEQLHAHTLEDSELSGTFLAFMVIATLLASVAVMTDSSIVVIGAMVVGPEFGPLAALAYTLVQHRLREARRALLALAVGFPVGIAASVALTLILKMFNDVPASIDASARPYTGFIAHPNEFSVIVALLAGVAGMLSLTSARTSVLIGVLVSVTTIPAAGNLGVALAIGAWHDAFGSAVQLCLNLLAMLLSAVVTLLVQKRVQKNKAARQLAN